MTGMEMSIRWNPHVNGVEFTVSQATIMSSFVVNIEDATIMSAKLAGIVLDHGKAS